MEGEIRVGNVKDGKFKGRGLGLSFSCCCLRVFASLFQVSANKVLFLSLLPEITTTFGLPDIFNFQPEVK